MFDEGKSEADQSVIGLQKRTHKCTSQARMTAFGTRRHLDDPKLQTDKPFEQTMISRQMGTNKRASQAGMLGPGTGRDIYDQKLPLQPVDNSTISLQVGTNKVASQKGMSVYGLGGKCMIPGPMPLQQNPSFTTGTKEWEPMGRKSAIVTTRQNTLTSTKKITPTITSMVTKALITTHRGELSP
uniref:Calponin 3 n=1 Tax=Molossus molossus TaxID=27622 RepID=A0A7J8I034_MOLMO|nr:hypothetical protein HJG59_010888 [Molossus molossus]